jgi:hypothetical protein
VDMGALEFSNIEDPLGIPYTDRVCQQAAPPDALSPNPMPLPPTPQIPARPTPHRRATIPP